MKHLSQTTIYALRAVYSLAEMGEREPVPVADIARKQQIPRRFLEEILRRLRGAGIVCSTRGKNGGYQLESSARELTAGEIVRVFEAEAGEAERGSDPLGDLLSEAAAAYMERLNSCTVEDLLLKTEQLRFVPNYCI